MRKFLISYFLTISLLLSSMGYSNYMLINNFDTSEVKGTIKYLSSDEFEGRLSGSLENAIAASFIKDKFESAGIEAFMDNYYQSFDVNYPNALSDEPMIAILDGDRKVHKILEYGVNYKEDLLNFRNTEIEFDKSHVINQDDDALYVKNHTGSVIFYTTNENNLAFRSSFVESSNQDLYIVVTNETLQNIKNYLNDGFSIYTYIPISIDHTTINNVVGVLKGKDSTLPPLVLGAHFDHVGTDLNNTIYSGALDNSSGTSFLIALTKYIKTLGTPDRDIIFVAFNAEEFGLLGSQAFVDQYQAVLKDSRVYNFDMIGSFDGIPLCIMGGKLDTAKTPLIEELTTVFQNKKIYFNYLFEDASDHSPFRNADIEAVTLCDNDTSRIHTPNDKVDYISETAIDRCFSIMKTQILNDSYSSNILYNNLEIILIFSCISSLVLILIYSGIKK
ncbi:M28 family metallopeptidase [Clostridium sp.]|uniref:M28 family metallopeptidase n=1 Tax=Clostridium sp. TaxID=1506 RepID=UPI00321651D5